MANTIEEMTARAMDIRGKFAQRKRVGAREWTRENIMQGLVVDVGDLMKLVMAKEGLRAIDDVDKKLAHELSDCLWCILVLSRMYGLDLAAEFQKTMAEIEFQLGSKT